MNYGLYLADYFALPFLPREKIVRFLGEVRGNDHFLTARDAGRGVLLVGPHVGNWEIAGFLLRDLDCPVHALSIRDPYPHFDEFRRRFREREGIRIIHVGAEVDAGTILEIQAALGRGEAVAMLGDRLYMGRSFTARFFGRDVRFPAGPLHIAALTGAPIVPFAAVRDGDRYRVELTDRIEVGATRDDLARAGRRLVQSFEGFVRAHPDQWFNFHPVFREEGLTEWRW
jgi:KDO2-lipid IV(A) lauroyltransferase